MGGPELTVAALSAEKLQILRGPPKFGEEIFTTGGGNIFDYNPTGSCFVHCREKQISFYTDTDSDPVRNRAQAEVKRLSFSPTGQYCVTHEPVLEREGKAHKNLKVWSCDDGELVAEFHRRGITDDHWPVIQFDAAETHVFFTVNNAIVYYSMDGDMTKADGKVKLEGVSQFKIGPAKRKLVATFVPESSKPAVFAVLDWEDGSTVNRKNFYRASRCNLHWNKKGSHVLCQSISDFDATNKSYFGESRLYLLSADGKTDMAVAMEDDPSIVDVAWSPDGETFAALGGHQPTKAVLYSAKGKVVCKMATGPYNHVRWNAQGRFVLLAGFGNLPGDIQLLERTEEGCRTMGACRSECSVLVEWSPCGRYFLTAAVAPRMRVDNRITIFTYYGEKLAQVDYAELLAARWTPVSKEEFPDRGVSPERAKQVESSRKKGVDVTVAAKKKAYVPPGQRGADGGRQNKVEGWDADEAANRIRNMAARREAGRVPEGAEGGAGASKAQSKNAKKRAAKKARAGAGDGDEDDGVDAAAEGVAAASLENGGANGDAPADPAKRIRNMRKRLTKIEAAKEKQARGDTLTPEQEESIAGEGALREEMRALGADDV